ncbi:MAG: ribbon-helix-helix protein, CopG family [Nitrospirae bacterium]|nr:ribbon-helix-helix protein, CopG family [Nitrospirota bacterium]
MRTKVVSIRLTEDEYDSLDEISIDRRMTIADMVRELIRQGTPEKEVIDGLRQIKEGVQELKGMALDKGLRKNLYYAVRNGIAIEEMFRRLPGVSELELSEYVETLDKKMKE